MKNSTSEMKQRIAGNGLATCQIGENRIRRNRIVKEITLEEIQQFQPEEYVYVDIRGEIAYYHGHIPGAICWSMDESPDRLPDNKKIIVYCSVGKNSVPVAQELELQGYEAYSLKEGYKSWLLKHCEELSGEELQKYERQMILPQVGREGQKKLKNARILIVGAGGLGSPAALYLAGAGIGTIGIVDADSVSISNLHRQIIHSRDRINMNKAESAKIAIQNQNELVNVRTYPFALTPENAESIIGNYDFIIDGTDSFETKFLINDTCVLLEKPFCHAGVVQFQGQVMTYVPGDFPCYRCVFEEIPEKGSVPNCSQAGIIGAMAGIIGCIQALEAIKYVLGAGELLTGKLLVVDGFSMNMQVIHLGKKNVQCRVCGDKREINSIKANAEEYVQEACPMKI